MHTMSTPSSNKLTPTPHPRSDKMKKQSRVVILRLLPRLLSRFSSAPKKEVPKLLTPSPPASTPKVEVDEKPLSANDDPSETNLTPAPSADPANPDQPVKKRKGPAPGSKRGLGQGVDNGLPKPRGKPGPKKKPRLEDGTIDHSGTTRPVQTDKVNGEGRHKLGPKANQGAINAGLRALDRSGKPVRKWIRKPFTVKSFTGVTWDLPSWKGGPKPLHQDAESSTESKDISQQSSSDVKPVDSSTAMESNPGDREPLEIVSMSTPMAASSPMPAPLSVTAHG